MLFEYIHRDTDYQMISLRPTGSQGEALQRRATLQRCCSLTEACQKFLRCVMLFEYINRDTNYGMIRSWEVKEERCNA